MTREDLFRSMMETGSMLCVGLDTNYALLPGRFRSLGVYDAVASFNREIIDATAPFCIAFKPNLAFYESRGLEGMRALEATVDYIRTSHPGKFLIADAKRGDIGNTASMYAEAYFKAMDFDAVTLSPYMGTDAVAPFLSYPGKYAIVVALSSNPSAADFELGGDGKPLYRKVMERMMEISSPDNMMFVVGATRAQELKGIRGFCPENFFLVPGVGAQGGSAPEVIQNGSNKLGGLLINSSRSIIYASSGDDFADAAAAAASVTARFTPAGLC